MADEIYEFEVRVDASQGEQQFRRLASAENQAKAAAAAFDAELKGLGTQMRRLDTDTSSYSRKQIQSLNAQDAAEKKAQKSLATRLEMEKKTATKNADAEKARSLREVAKASAVAEAAERKRITALRQEEQQIKQSSAAMNQYAKSIKATGGKWGEDPSAEQNRIQGLANTRYALYDAAQAYTFLAGALVAPGVAALKFGADYQKAFASVARTTLAVGPELESLRLDLVKLSTDMPTSFANLSQIATIGAQLGVATDNLGAFTDVVAMFSATTNVSVDQAAMGLGRLAQLTKTSGTQYENLASSIYQVGITSVATESEILDMASQIATSGNLAGLTNEQIVALAGSLASLGVQPEAARGSLMRIFNIIETGATGGGKALDKLSAVSGLSAKSIQKDWGTDSQAVFTAFVNGLGRIQDAGGNTNEILKSMGIGAVRDIRTLQVLANNTDVYASLLVQSNQAYKSGDSLRRGFALQMDNLIDKLTVFGQTLQAVGAELGKNTLPILAPIVAGFQKLADVLLMLAQTPVGAGIMSMGIILAGALGAVLAFRAAVMLGQASIAALTTSLVGIRTAAGTLSTGVVGLARDFIGLTQSIRGATVATEQNAMAAGSSAANMGAESAALNGVSASATKAAFGVRILNGAMKASVIGLALIALPTILDELGKAFETNTDKAERFFGSLDSLSNAVKQDTQTYRETGDSIRLITTSVTDANAVTPDWVTSLNAASGGQVNLNNAVHDTTTGVKDQTIAIGEATKATIANMYASDKNFSEFYTKNKEVLTKAGFNMQTLLERTLKGTGDAYLNEVKAQLVKLNQTAKPLADNFDVPFAAAGPYDAAIKGVTDYSKATDGVNAKILELAQANQILADAGIKVGDTSAAAKAGLDEEALSATDLLTSLSSVLSTSLETAQGFDTISKSMVDNGNAFNTYSSNGIANMEALQGVISGLASSSGTDTEAFGEKVAGVYEMLQSRGVDMAGSVSYLGDILNETLGKKYGLDFTTAAARTNLRAFIQDQIGVIQANVVVEQSALNAALAMGQYAEAGRIAGLQNAEALRIAALQGILAGLSKSHAAAQAASNRATAAAAPAHKKAAAATAKHAKEVRTLTDYVDDLSNVMKKANDIRFGLDDAFRDLRKAQRDIKETTTSFAIMQEVFDTRLTVFGAQNGQDAITSSVRDMASKFADARDKVTDAVQGILEAQASLAQNSADTKVAQYQLSVAQQYGDELRSAQLRAKLADLDATALKNQQDLAKAQKNLSSAQQATNTTLVGSSDAAIANRKSVQGLLGDYLDYIKSVKESGASQDEVNRTLANARKDFLNQAVALGFNVDQLQAYANILNPVTQKQKDQTDAADDAKQKMEDLTKAWQDYILQLVNSGASQKKINDAIKAAKEDLAKQAAALGLSKTASEKYGKAIDDLAKIIDKLPKHLTMTANTDPAQRALDEFKAKAKDANASASNLQDTLNGLSGKDYKIKTELVEPSKHDMEKAHLRALYLGFAAAYAKSGSEYAKLNMEAYYKRWKAYSTGGYTGRGGANEPAGVVHKGEYVVKKSLVNQSTGLPYADALGRIVRGYQSGGYVSSPQKVSAPRTVMVELSPTDRSLLAAAGNVSLSLDGKLITDTVNRNNRNAGVRR